MDKYETEDRYCYICHNTFPEHYYRFKQLWEGIIF
jgi:hypothetical protein